MAERSRYPLGAEPPMRFETITDFEIVLVQIPSLGTVMEWRSLALGLLTPFLYYAHLEDPEAKFLDASGDPRRPRDGWRPVGTRTHPYIDLDQGFVLIAWADDRLVHVEYGDDEPEPTIRTWYRVPTDHFEVAWKRMLAGLDIG